MLKRLFNAVLVGIVLALIVTGVTLLINFTSNNLLNWPRIYIAAMLFLLIGIFTFWFPEPSYRLESYLGKRASSLAFVSKHGLQWLSDPTHLRNVFKGVLIIGSLLILDYFIIRYFNTVRLPYLFSGPGVFVFLVVAVVVFSFLSIFNGVTNLWIVRIVGVLLMYAGQSYVVHAYDVMVNNPSVIAVFHFVGTVGTFAALALNFLNQAVPRVDTEPAPFPDDAPYVAAVIPTYDEPTGILARTITALANLDYPKDKLYILVSDDGHRAAVQELAAGKAISYNLGAKRDAKAGNLNSALEHLAEHFPQAELILTQDADEVIHPSFLKKVVGYFSDPAIAFVQTPKEALTPADDPFGTRDRMFYDSFQLGRNGGEAAFSCGSGVVWRLDAIRSIGGFSTWNLVEDLTTSYALHSKGWQSAYWPEILSIGLAPDDIPGLLKQRGTWALDTLRLFLFDNPLFKKGRLTLRQRLQYFELGFYYINAAIFTPLIMLVPILSLATGKFLPIEGSALFPWMILIMVYFLVLARGQLNHWIIFMKYLVGHSPTFMKALWGALWSRNHKPAYKVTRKTHQKGFYGHLLLLQFLYIIAALVLTVKGVFFMPDAGIGERVTNIGIALFFSYLLSGICAAAFYRADLFGFPLNGEPEKANMMRKPLVRLFANLTQTFHR